MLYHGFNNRGIDRVGERTKEEVEGMKNGAPIYSGLFVPQLKPDEIPAAIDTALKAGANGVAVFASPLMTEQHWTAIGKATAQEHH